MHKLFAKVRRNQKGFTLIELLVVVAIIGLLAAFAVPKLFDAVNKAKEAPGAADLQTIAGALDRYHLEKHAFPITAVETALKNDYLKTSTKFLNGWGIGYLYGTTPAGDGYILIDPGHQTVGATVTVTCGATAYTFTTSATTLAVNATITKAHISACVEPANMKMITF